MKPVISLLALTALLSSAPAVAADTMIGEWKLIDQGEVCALQRKADGSESFLVTGVLHVEGLGFTSLKMTNIKDRDPYKVDLGFSGKPAARFLTGTFTMEGFNDGGPQQGFMLFGYPLNELIADDYRGDITLKWNGRIVHRLPLDGLKPALQAMTACADEQAR